MTEESDIDVEDDNIYEETVVTSRHLESKSRNQSAVSLASLSECKGGMRTLWSEIPEVGRNEMKYILPLIWQSKVFFIGCKHCCRM